MINCSTDDLIKAGVFMFLYSLLEYWLGKTDKVKAGSVIQLGLMAISLLIIFILRRKNGREE